MNNPRNRTVVVETLYHQGGAAEPVSIVTRCSKPNGPGQAYSRVLMAKDEWYQLESGWVEAPGTLHIRNDDKRHKLLVGIGGKEHIMAVAHISPEHSLRLEPTDVRAFYIRSEEGLAKFTVTVIPG